MSEATAPRHLTELQIAQALLPGAAQPSCPVPGCTRCAETLAEARAAAARFHAEVLPRGVPQGDSVRDADGSALEARVAPRGPLPARLAWWTRPAALGGLAMAAAAAVLWVKWPRPAPLLLDEGGDASAPIGPEYVGLKGDEAVRAYLRRAGEISPLVDGDEVQPGDAIRFIVDARRGRHALVVSIDGAQQVSVYFPFGGEASQELPLGGEEELPGAVELDETLGDERIWILLSEQPIAVADLRPALARLAGQGAAAVSAAAAGELTRGAPGLAGVHVETMLLHKRAAR